MQTFLPDPSFVRTAQIIDDARLRKQQTEAEQILNVLRNPNPKGWANHPAVLQWKGYEAALECYINAISRECRERGFKGRHDGPTEVFMQASIPWWMRDESVANRIYESHRSRLLFKGRVDAAAVSLKRNMGILKVNNWLVTHGYPKKNVFKLDDILRLEQYISDQGYSPYPNYYRQFWPTQDDTIPYVWPVTKGMVRTL